MFSPNETMFSHTRTKYFLLTFEMCLLHTCAVELLFFHVCKCNNIHMHCHLVQLLSSTDYFNAAKRLTDAVTVYSVYDNNRSINVAATTRQRVLLQ